MPPVLRFVLAYLAVISLIACVVTVLDKRRARKKEWRVPEHTLLLLSILGGSAAMYITMRIIRHKTQKAKFMVGIPVIFMLQLMATGDVYKRQEQLWRQGWDSDRR